MLTVLGLFCGCPYWATFRLRYVFSNRAKNIVGKVRYWQPRNLVLRQGKRLKIEPGIQRLNRLLFNSIKQKNENFTHYSTSDQYFRL
jgi:hypothetical protein